MKQAIDDALQSMPNLELIVFSGGECFMLKEDLYETIAYASSCELLTRCVTNGYWGARKESAVRIAKLVREAGLTEINISTGLDHQQWVSFESVVNCSTALIEKDSSESTCWKAANEHPDIKRMLSSNSKKLTLICNTWMPFKTDSIGRGDSDNKVLDSGCHQLFSNLVITPHEVVSACCGLTFEHIPEMRLGNYKSKHLSEYIDEVASDFLKLWIHVDGPRQVARSILGDKRNMQIEDSVHICQACAVLHQDKEIRTALENHYHEFVPDVVGRYMLNKLLEQQMVEGTQKYVTNYA
jgi:hypothetical protein